VQAKCRTFGDQFLDLRGDEVLVAKRRRFTGEYLVVVDDKEDVTERIVGHLAGRAASAISSCSTADAKNSPKS